MNAVHADHRPETVVRLALAVWAFGFLALAAAQFLDVGPSLLVLLRPAVLSLVGLALCVPLALAAQRVWSRGAGVRGALLIGGLIAAVTIQTLVDVRVSPGLREIADVGVYAEIRAGDPYRHGVMRLAVQSEIAVYLCLYGLFGVGLALMLSAVEARERERQLTEARGAMHLAQLAALRFQLNPHFLFNALNAVGSLIEAGRGPEAARMTQGLSAFLRRSLAETPSPTAPLEDEFAAVSEYLEIEHVRFGDRMRVVLDCPRELADAPVPSLLLQPLAENAVTYGVALADSAITIRIRAARVGADLLIEVANETVAPGPSGGGHGVGLRNARERLALLYGPRASLEAGVEGGLFVARVRLPLEEQP